MARLRLRECVKRHARSRVAAERVPARMVHAERQLLFSLVHEYVCQCSGYDPLLDGQLAWACWYLRWCEGEAASFYIHEDAQLMLILVAEYPACEVCGKDAAAGEAGDEDFDSHDERTYSERGAAL